MSNVIGIIGAMDIEVNGIVSSMSNVTEKAISGIKFYSGTLHNKNVVVAKCGIGKVFAAICAQTMILEYKPSVIINSGVAGSLTKDLGVLNVAIASNVVLAVELGALCKEAENKVYSEEWCIHTD